MAGSAGAARQRRALGGGGCVAHRGPRGGPITHRHWHRVALRRYCGGGDWPCPDGVCTWGGGRTWVEPGVPPSNSCTGGGCLPGRPSRGGVAGSPQRPPRRRRHRPKADTGGDWARRQPHRRARVGGRRFDLPPPRPPRSLASCPPPLPPRASATPFRRRRGAASRRAGAPTTRRRPHPPVDGGGEAWRGRRAAGDGASTSCAWQPRRASWRWRQRGDGRRRVAARCPAPRGGRL